MALAPIFATRGPVDPVHAGGMAVVALVARAAVHRLAPARWVASCAGASTAVTALWLVPQRPDLGSALVLSMLVGAGSGLAAPMSVRARTRTRRWWTSFGALAGALGVLRLLSARTALFVVVVAVALLIGIMCARAAHRASGEARGRSRTAERVTAGVLVVSTSQ